MTGAMMEGKGEEVVWAEEGLEAEEGRCHDFVMAHGLPLQRDPAWTRCVSATGTVFHWAELFGWREGERPTITDRFVVPRSEWLRGEGSAGSYLLRVEDRRRCCLGHLGRCLGAPDTLLENETSPSFAPSVPWPEEMLNVGGVEVANSTFAEHLMTLNDDPDLDKREREVRLKNAFAQIGWGVEFKG